MEDDSEYMIDKGTTPSAPCDLTVAYKFCMTESDWYLKIEIYNDD